MRTLFASGQTFSMATDDAWIASGEKSGFKLLKPPGNKFISTGASLKPEFLRSTDP